MTALHSGLVVLNIAGCRQRERRER